MPRAELKLLAQARKDMIELRRYSRREFGLTAADRLVDDLEASSRSCSTIRWREPNFRKKFPASGYFPNAGIEFSIAWKAGR